MTTSSQPLVAIACGGTGGHLFPGLAVAEALQARGCEVALLISPKEVDQQAVRALRGLRIITLPVCGLSGGRAWSFICGFFKGYRASLAAFKNEPPVAVLSMGGFTAAPPILAGRKLGAKTFLHESNTIPGRANRWLSHVVDEGFVYFHEASGRMPLAAIHVAGMPVRSHFFEPVDVAGARTALGLRPAGDVLLVMGGSQGASGINDQVLAALPLLQGVFPALQYLHLTGSSDLQRVEERYRAQGVKAVVRPFLTEMELALGAATVAISRAGASSLAELAAMTLPALLVPYPEAADEHQFYNARAFVETGAALQCAQRALTPETLVETIRPLLEGRGRCEEMRQSLKAWQTPGAAGRIADRIISAVPACHSLKNFSVNQQRNISSNIENDVLRAELVS